jgi:C4-type Zn-finger protein
MRTCPDCRKKTKKYGEPVILSTNSCLLDQIIICSQCNWCGVDTKLLTRTEAEKFQAIAARPKQLRMKI